MSLLRARSEHRKTENRSSQMYSIISRRPLLCWPSQLSCSCTFLQNSWTFLVADTVDRVTMHHRQESHLLTETQEEMVLIAGFGLFWFGKTLRVVSFLAYFLTVSYSCNPSVESIYTKLRWRWLRRKWARIRRRWVLRQTCIG